MLNLLGGIDVVNWLLLHPCTYYKLDDVYVPTWVSLQGIFANIKASSVRYSVPVENNNPHGIVIEYIQNNPNFIIALIVRLFIDNIHVCARNVVWYTSEHGSNALHADMLCINRSKKEVVVICIYYKPSDIAYARCHARKVIDLLRIISTSTHNIKAVLLPLQKYIHTEKITLQSTEPRIKKKRTRITKKSL